MHGKDWLSYPVPKKRDETIRKFCPSVFLRELSHACRKRHCKNSGINAEGLTSPPSEGDRLLHPQSKTVNQSGDLLRQ